MEDRATRRYDNSRRLAATRVTKAEVAAAARALFVEQGYPATTVAQIAERSERPEATVYRLFGSKRGILAAVLDVTIGGDDEPVEFGQRAEVRAAFDTADPGTMLDTFAHLVRSTLERAAELHHVLVTSAAVDTEAAEMLQVVGRQRHAGQSQIVRALARAGELRAGLGVAAAADIVYALLSPEVYRILTGERRWSGPRYERWLAATLRAQLLDAPGR